MVFDSCHFVLLFLLSLPGTRMDLYIYVTLLPQYLVFFSPGWVYSRRTSLHVASRPRIELDLTTQVWLCNAANLVPNLACWTRLEGDDESFGDWPRKTKAGEVQYIICRKWESRRSDDDWAAASLRRFKLSLGLVLRN